jgi:prepilin-type N-terminal cleavage/methylation domain-containing protein
MRPLQNHKSAFTLIELLVVIAMIVILAGLLVPAFQAVQNQARKTQAKNDLTQIVTAVNAFYTEYGQYPVPSTASAGTDIVFTAALGGLPSYGNDWLLNELRGCTASDTASCSVSANGQTLINTRQIVYISPPIVKDPNSPKSGIGIATLLTTINRGRFFDPWGSPYNVEFDSSYDNTVLNPYGGSGGAGVDPIRQGVIGWSLGSDQQLGTNSDGIYKNTTTGAQSDDVISWQ